MWSPCLKRATLRSANAGGVCVHRGGVEAAQNGAYGPWGAAAGSSATRLSTLGLRSATVYAREAIDWNALAQQGGESRLLESDVALARANEAQRRNWRWNHCDAVDSNVSRVFSRMVRGSERACWTLEVPPEPRQSYWSPTRRNPFGALGHQTGLAATCPLLKESTRFTGLEAGGLGAGVSEDGAPCGSQAVRLSNRTFGGTESPPVEPKRVHYGVEDSRQRTEFDKPTSPSPPPPPPASQPYASDPLSPPCVPRCRSNIKGLKPQEIVNFLNEHIVGQLEAKKAVANALRNRWRRQQVRNQELRDDILPKNILMIGPTGVGKTEIARRMAKIIDAPFIKVEATKYTEVGFHGRDVDTIIKDLVELALRRQYLRIEADLFPQAQRLADEKILQALAGQVSIEADKEMYENLRLGRLDNQLVTLDVPSSYASGGGPFGANNCPSSDYSSHSGLGADVNGFSQNQEFPVFSAFNGTSLWTAAGSSGRKERMEKKTMSIKEARTVLSHLEFSRLMGSVAKTRVTQQALEAVEQEGIVFVDEIDKICSSKAHSYTGPDASAEGVQRDLLPLIEGTTVTTRYGNVKTDHILFIASGAFHTVKPSDMMAELQGRLPVRVELKPLSEEDFRKILFKTRHNLLEQNIALLATEGVTLLFEPSAIWEIARSAYEVNSFVENIGARRLITIIEKVMEEISFMAPEMDAGSLLRVTEDVVRRAVEPLTAATDLHKFIL